MYSRLKHNLPIYLINLEKRTDRLEKFKSKYNMILPKVNVIKAIDGNDYDFEKILPLFQLKDFKKNVKNPYNNHQWRSGVLGCALSHFSRWQTILLNDKMKNDDFALILEDDFEVCNNFLPQLNNLLDELAVDKKWDIVYLGFTDYKNTNDTKVSDKLIQFSADKRLNGGGTFSYIIRKRGAKKLFDLANKKSIQQAIDWFMIEQFGEVVAYKCEPELVFSKVQNGNEKGDSDVQNRTAQVLAYRKKLREFKNKNKKKSNLESINEEPSNTEPEPMIIPQVIETQEQKEENEKNLLKESVQKEYNEVIIGSNIYFKNENNHLFNISQEQHNYHGKILDGKIVNQNISRHLFTYDIQKLQEKVKDKQVILFYVNKKSIYHIRKLCESLVQKYNVFVVGDLFYNIKINGVYYIYYKNKNVINPIIKLLNVKKIFITDFNYFLFSDKLEGQKIYYIHNKLDLFPDYDCKVYKNNGIGLIKNYINLVDNVLFFSKDEKENFELFYNLELNNQKMACLPLFKNMKMNLSKKENIIVCYDKHIENAIKFLKVFNSVNNNKYKLILFNEDVKLEDENIIYKTRNEYKLMEALSSSKIFITFETNEYTFYNTFLSIHYNCVSIVPKYYSELNNKCVTYSSINMEKINEINEILSNSSKVEQYEKNNEKTIKEHMNNNIWATI